MLQQPSSSVVARVQAIEGTLLRLTPSGFTGELVAGETVGAGDVLVTGADARALVALAGGGTLMMTGNSRAAIDVAADGGGSRLVVVSGVFVLDASGAGGEAARVHVESAAAGMTIHGATVAIGYELASGFRAALVGEAEGIDVAARVANDGGVYVLEPINPAVIVEHWFDPPRPLTEHLAGDLPDWLPAAAGADVTFDHDSYPSPGAAATDDPALLGDDASSAPDRAQEESPEDADADAAATGDDAPLFMTGAGMPEAGDISFVIAPTPPRGLADHAAAAIAPAPLPGTVAAPTVPAIAAPSSRTAPAGIPDHGLDAVLGLQPPALVEPPLPPRPPGPPHLRDWEPGGHLWEFEGSAVFSSGDREWPSFPDKPLELIRPVEGETMALLAPNGALPFALERFLAIPDRTLQTLVEGVTPCDGSAMRTSMVLKAGQTLVFDTLFDAFDALPRNDFAAFTVSDGRHGEAFVLSSVAATGSLGATPWQSFEYTVGASGRYTIGFVVINDMLPETRSRLYVDNLRNHLETDGLTLIGEQGDAFGGHFAQFGPEAPAPEPGAETLIDSFETRIANGEGIGRIDHATQWVEPDGERGVFTPTDGEAMAVLHAYGASRPALERFLGLHPSPDTISSLPYDLDGSAAAFGAATRLSVAVSAGDQLSFDWLFDAGDTLPDNDFAVFTVADADASAVFKLADVRAVGGDGASGWRTSVYTAAVDAELTVGFAVVNDRAAGYYSDTENSRLLIDNVRLNRDFADGYQTVDLPEPGTLATLPAA